jgi:hypothetical protein
MGSPTRTRARKTAQSNTRKKATSKDKPEPITQEEADIAAAQENAIFLQEQINILSRRVGTLRVTVNRQAKRIAELEAKS